MSKRKRECTKNDKTIASIDQPDPHKLISTDSLKGKIIEEGHSRGTIPPVQNKPTTSLRPHSTTSVHPIIFTIGHGTRTLSMLIDILQSAHISKLVDVRSIPRSSTNPQFNRDYLESSPELQAENVDYLWLGATLGGFRTSKQPNIAQHSAIRVASFKNYAGYMSNTDFRDGLEVLKSLAQNAQNDRSQVVAIMCSETLWWRCHRRMIADMLVVEGWDVQHLGIKKGDAMKHVLWDIARTNDEGRLIYDAK